MPELPELEAFKSYFEAHCLHKTIANVTCTDTKVIKSVTFAAFKKALIGAQFKHAERLGKYLIISLKNSDQKVVMHFGLTGSLEYTKDAKNDVRFSVVRFIFKDHSVLHWKSIRKFEKIWLVSDLNKIKALKTLGPDPLKLSAKEFSELIEQNQTKNIKAFLMDQDKIAGIGNEYSDEILFQAGIDPHHAIKDLSKPALTKLYKQVRSVLKYATKVQVSIIKKQAPDFFSQDNRKIFKKSYLQAHRHIDMICPKSSAHTLKRVKLAGRTTYYCPEDQR